eukprot:4070358-Prymnesium_polylepis.2
MLGSPVPTTSESRRSSIPSTMWSRHARNSSDSSAPGRQRKTCVCSTGAAAACGPPHDIDLGTSQPECRAAHRGLIPSAASRRGAVLERATPGATPGVGELCAAPANSDDAACVRGVSGGMEGESGSPIESSDIVKDAHREGPGREEEELCLALVAMASRAQL